MVLQASAHNRPLYGCSGIHICFCQGSGGNLHISKFLGNLGFPQTSPTPVFADNVTCIAWSEGSVGGSERAKHVDLRVHFVHKARTAGYLQLHKVDSKLNAADIDTKASTPTDVYEDLRRRIIGY
jgi:hypothetical protein